MQPGGRCQQGSTAEDGYVPHHFASVIIPKQDPRTRLADALQDGNCLLEVPDVEYRQLQLDITCKQAAASANELQGFSHSIRQPQGHNQAHVRTISTPNQCECACACSLVHCNCTAITDSTCINRVYGHQAVGAVSTRMHMERPALTKVSCAVCELLLASLTCCALAADPLHSADLVASNLKQWIYLGSHACMQRSLCKCCCGYTEC